MKNMQLTQEKLQPKLNKVSSAKNIKVYPKNIEWNTFQ